MAVFEDQGAIRSIICADFSLIFEHQGDRWTHSIAIGNDRQIIARAIEWHADQDDPQRVVSPVFQELFLQPDSAGSPQGLCVGMSGRHHFSGVFAVSETSQEVVVSVDVADRVRDEMLGFASSYAVMLHSGDLQACDDTLASWAVAGGTLRIQVQRPGLIGLAEAGRRATRIQATADPGRISADPTHRWQYQWIWRRD